MRNDTSFMNSMKNILFVQYLNRLIDGIGSLEEVIAKDFPKAVLAFPKKQPIVGPIAEIAKLASLF